MQNRGPLSGFSPLAGVSARTALVLFAFGTLCLAWHQVSGHVSLAITMLAYVLIAALAVTFGAWAWYVLAWVRHRVRNPELLAGRRTVRAEVAAAESPQVTAARQPAAIEPPRVYLNVTDDQLAALMRHHTEGN
jgi:hypothetical protein